MAKLAARVTAVVVAVKKITQAIGEMEDAYKVQVNAETKLAAALKATGNVVGITQKEMQAFASEMQKMTTYGDEAVISAQAVMVTFRNIGQDVFPRAITAAADMSAMLGTDLQSSVIQLGKALNDPILGVTALNRIGITFTQGQRDMIAALVESNDTLGAQKIILAEVEAQLGGTARALGETAIAAKEKLGNAIGDLKEGFGKLITEALAPSRTKLRELIEDMTEAQKATLGLLTIGEQNIGSFAPDMSEADIALDQLRARQRDLIQLLNQAAMVQEQWGGKLTGKNFMANLSASFTGLLTGNLRELATILQTADSAEAAIRQELEANKQLISEVIIEGERLKKQKEAALEAENLAWREKRLAIEKELRKQLDINARTALVYGEAFDKSAADVRAFADAQDEMLRAGFDPLSGGGFSRFLENFPALAEAWRAWIQTITESADEQAAAMVPLADAWLEYQTRLRGAKEEAGLIVPLGEKYIPEVTEATEEASKSMTHLEVNIKSLIAALEATMVVSSEAFRVLGVEGTASVNGLGASARTTGNAIGSLGDTFNVFNGDQVRRIVEITDEIESMGAAMAILNDELIGVSTDTDNVIEAYTYTADEVANVWLDAFQTIGGLQQNWADEHMDIAQRLREANQDAANATTQSERDAAEERAKIAAKEYEDMYAKRSRWLAFEKAAAIVQIAINTAIEASKVLANPFHAAAVVVAGIAQGAAVLSQQIPQLAEGGIVRQPTLALIGERGPERVEPLGRSRGGTPVIINVEGSVISENQLRGFVAETVALMNRGY
jgi:hypothetical protein